MKEQGATCSLVLTFPAGTGSGNPDNCGNACNCDNSACPAVPVICSDIDCGGSTTPGKIGMCNASLLKGLGGCPCSFSDTE